MVFRRGDGNSRPLFASQGGTERGYNAEPREGKEDMEDFDDPVHRCACGVCGPADHHAVEVKKRRRYL